jgi:8-oxo-dGDP phosphatase
VAETVGGEPVLWRTFGMRVLRDGQDVRLTEVDVGFPSGERVWLPVVRLPRSVGVVLLDGRGGVLLVRRYRFLDERWGWELPGGQVEEDEEDIEAAARELEEQTGYRAGALERLVAFQPAAEVVDSERVVFVGSEPVLMDEPVALDESERAEWVALASVSELIAAGEIWNAASVVGLLSVLARGR